MLKVKLIGINTQRTSSLNIKVIKPSKQTLTIDLVLTNLHCKVMLKKRNWSQQNLQSLSIYIWVHVEPQLEADTSKQYHDYQIKMLIDNIA